MPQQAQARDPMPNAAMLAVTTAHIAEPGFGRAQMEAPVRSANASIAHTTLTVSLVQAKACESKCSCNSQVPPY